MPKQFYTIGDRHYNVSLIQHVTIRKDSDSGEENAFIRIMGNPDSIIYTRSESETLFQQILQMVAELTKH